VSAELDVIAVALVIAKGKDATLLLILQPTLAATCLRG
jgi:hypothetical protein